MHLQQIEMQIIEFGVLLLAADIGGKFTQKFNLGEIVGQILGGVLVSPHTLELLYKIFLSDQGQPGGSSMFPLEHLGVMQISEYARILEGYLFFVFLFLGIIAFSVGEEFNRDRLRHMGWDIGFISVFQSMLTFLIVFLGFWLVFRFSLIQALLIGSISIASAPVLTFALVNKLKIEGTLRRILANLIVVADILEVIFFAVFLAIAVVLQDGEGHSISYFSQEIIKELCFAGGLGVGMFLLLKFSLKKQLSHDEQQDDDQTFFSLVLSGHPTPSVEIFVLIMGILAIGVGIGIHFQLPFLLSAVLAGILIANFHSHAIFDSLKIDNIMPLFNLFFFALIGSMLRIESFTEDSVLYILGFIVCRAAGKILGTWGGCFVTKQDPKLTACLPKLMLPQAGMSAVEMILVATVLEKSGGMQIFNTVIPALVIFELTGAWLSERTLLKWYEWTVGEREALLTPERGEYDFPLDDLLGDRVFEMMATTKEEALIELGRFCVTRKIVPDMKLALHPIREREQLGSTGIGNGIALPHCRTGVVQRTIVVCGILRYPVAWGAPDLQPVDLVFLLLNPDQEPEQHLQAIRTISIALQHPDFKHDLKQAFAQNIVGDYLQHISNVAGTNQLKRTIL